VPLRGVKSTGKSWVYGAGATTPSRPLKQTPDPDTFLGLKIIQKCCCCRGQLGDLGHFPDSTAGFGRKRKKKRRVWKERRERKRGNRKIRKGRAVRGKKEERKGTRENRKRK